MTPEIITKTAMDYIRAGEEVPQDLADQTIAHEKARLRSRDIVVPDSIGEFDSGLTKDGFSLQSSPWYK